MYDNRIWTNNTLKTILFWTTYFGTYDLLLEWNKTFAKRGLNCYVTNDHTSLGRADAVLFHLSDLYRSYAMPEYKDSNQIWILLNKESPPHVDVSIHQSMKLNHAFNWTMSYRRDSTVLANYGEFVSLSQAERSKYRQKNYAQHRTKMAASIISNCNDKAQRYRLIHELAMYINIDQYGHCGNLACPQTDRTICRSSDYRFRIAFENSNCRDYVSEKFWNALADGVIPIVNWRANQRPAGTVPPKTFINVYDFESVAALAKYLNLISVNEEEFNRYFEWKKRFRIDMDTNAIHLCSELNKARSNRDIPDLTAWIRNDTCTTDNSTTLFGAVADRIGRFLRNIR